MNLSFDQTMITVGTRRFVFVPDPAGAREYEDHCSVCAMDEVICALGDACCGWGRDDGKTGIWKEVRS